MKKLFLWGWKNILFLSTLVLLMFIPLYPKLPLLDVKNTWVYIRVEDFVVLFVLVLWLFLFFKKRVSIKTPLTLPIMIYWLIGALATIHGVLLIFPQTSNVFPNVAFLSFLRHVEYISLFFVAYCAMREKKFLNVIIGILVFTLLLVVGYGIGQKYLGFPAYLTMNEEFAKGIPIRLSQLSRVPSTFAGHYDLAAYLVLIIPILVSLVFGFRNWLVKIFILAAVVLGFGLLFTTVSRVSFFVLLIALFIVLFFQNKKLVIFLLPPIGILMFLFVSLQPALLSRFGDTIKEVNVLVDAKTGEPIGNVKFIPSRKFENKIIIQKKVSDNAQLDTSLTPKEEIQKASPSSLLSLSDLPQEVPLVVAPNLSTGENLPQGTGYINLPLSPVTKKLRYFFYEASADLKSSTSAGVFIFHGDFIIKKASAYDLSFTTRFQGEWPRAQEAFKRNILLGSGYGSVSLAVDNNYFRMLGETGVLGTASFFAIFLALGIYIKRVLPNVDSKVAKSFILGFVAGVIGIALNATLIDVFEASKIAFLLWILTGVVLGILVLYQSEKIELYSELKKAATSTYAVILYLFIAAVFIFSPMLNDFFIGDDFTWLRWVADCSGSVNNSCSPFATIVRYFTEANGFFYRPGTKIYFLMMYSIFWFNQIVYHAVSILLHFIVAGLFFLVARKILRSHLLAVLAAFLFLLISGYSEAVFWISSTGFLFTAVFALSSLLFFILWEEKKKIHYYFLSLITLTLGLLFHEQGVIIPLLLILYKYTKDESVSLRKLFSKFHYLFLFVPVGIYLVARYSAQSHWFSGDYSYNLLKFPFNIVGNILGYIFITVFGPISLSFYEVLRNFLKGNILIALLLTIAVVFMTVFAVKIFKSFEKEERRIILFGFLFFAISLIPFLGLGNITSRYSYLASLGLIIVFVFFIKKLYVYLLSYGKDIGLVAITTLIAVFFLLHIIQVQQIHLDWNGAGEKTRRFIISIDALYSDYWSKEAVELHFVNVPIRYGEAWVFPVGLRDALWFAFENRNLKVYIHSSIKEALDQGGTSALNPIFKFNDDGSLEPVFRPKKFSVNK